MDKPFAPLPPAPRTPSVRLLDGACDAHVHLMGGPDDFPLWDGRVENPAQDIDFAQWLRMYREHLDTIGCSRSIIVHSIFYGTNNAVTLAALEAMGPGFAGVGLLPDGAGRAEVAALAGKGVKAVRLNYVHGGVLSWDGAKAMAPLLADHGMHIQMLLHADRHLDALAADIEALPVPLVIDHLGWPSTDLSPSRPGIATACALMGAGHIHMKLSAPYRMAHAPYTEAAPLMRVYLDAAAERCLWGSDWPHVMLNGAGMPHVAELLDQAAGLMSAAERQAVFVDTPNALFFDSP
ncbi:MAG: amidohydrolase family protein [Pseudomonadota bacterium]